MGDLQQPGLRLLRIRERATFEAEELGLEQRVGNGRTVHVDKRRVRTRTRLMNEVGNQTLTRTRLALDEDGR